VGSQYRSVIFYHTSEQKQIAEASKQKIQESAKYSKDVVTEIVAASDFWIAEKYHQRYFEINGMTGCPIRH
jgi:peptide-methionine (S)-S-oxide reductase